MINSTVDTGAGIIESSKKLDIVDRITIANALLKDIPAQLIKGIKLPLLSGLKEQELRALTKVSLSLSRNRRLRYLLKKNREGKLTQLESAEIDNLLAECDQIAFLKAKAQYTLRKIQGE